MEEWSEPSSRENPVRTGDTEYISSGEPDAQLRRLLLSQDDLRTLGITFSRQHLWRLIQRGEFPAPVELGCGARKAWRADEIEAWVRGRPRFVSEAAGSETV